MSAANDLRRKWHGGKWIRVERRLGIYLRDGLACVWCGASVEQDGVQLSLDHLKCNVVPLPAARGTPVVSLGTAYPCRSA